MMRRGLPRSDQPSLGSRATASASGQASRTAREKLALGIRSYAHRSASVSSPEPARRSASESASMISGGLGCLPSAGCALCRRRSRYSRDGRRRDRAWPWRVTASPRVTDDADRSGRHVTECLAGLDPAIFNFWNGCPGAEEDRTIRVPVDPRTDLGDAGHDLSLGRHVVIRGKDHDVAPGSRRAIWNVEARMAAAVPRSAG